MPYLSINIDHYVLNIEDYTRELTQLAANPPSAANTKRIKLTTAKFREAMRMLKMHRDELTVKQHAEIVEAIKQANALVVSRIEEL
jgi:hypothetical protein